MTSKQAVIEWDTLITRFWKDFSIPIQEEDASVNFANPSDVVRSLVRSRNWMGTISENLINIDKALTKEQRISHGVEDLLRDFTIKALSAVDSLSGVAVKNKETQDAFILSRSSKDELTLFYATQKTLREQRDKINHLKYMRNSFELMKRALEKTTDWLVQYLNWHKFEIRERV